MARIVLNTFGSFGDIHPYLAIAIELTRRGHSAVMATCEVYRQKIEAEGVLFAAVRPNVGELMGNTELLKKLWHPKKGSEHLLRDYLLPAVRESFSDLKAACVGANLLLTHSAAYGGPVVAEVMKIPWLSVALQPAILFSRSDPAVIAALPWARHLYKLGRWPFATMMSVAESHTRRWAEPVLVLRRELGLSTTANPVMQGLFSPLGTLALFSPLFAAPQKDWPVKCRATGFVFYDRCGDGFGLPAEHPSGMSPELQAFIAAGPAPLLFTLGSSAVMQPGSFYRESAAAAKKLGMRAVMLVGKVTADTLGLKPNDALHVEAYASYAALMPKCAAIVHQGGIGTVAQAMSAGKPMLVVPWAHDQPDNAERLKRLGVARVQVRTKYTAASAERQLRELLSRPTYRQKAAELVDGVNKEAGLSAACEAIESTLLMH